jgi:oligosaccharide repeat unit polymerase
MYLLISLVILFISYRLFRKASGTLDVRKINISSFVFFSLFIMTFIGSLQIQYGLIADGYVPENDSLRTYGWMIVMYALIAVPIGMLIACRLFKVNSMREFISQYNSSPLYFRDNSWESSFKHSQYLFSLLSIFTVIFIIYMHGERTPLFHLLLGSQDYMEMGMLRHESGFANIEYGEYMRIVIAPLAAFSSVFAYSAYCYVKSMKKKMDIIWLTFMVIFSLLINTYALVKNPIIYWLLGFIVVHILIEERVSFKFILMSALVFIGFIGLSTIFIQGAREDIDIVDLLSVVTVSAEVFANRITYGQLFGTYLSLDIFPDTLPHIFFSSTGNFIHQLLNLPFSPDYGRLIMSIWRPDWPTAGHCTTYFMGEAWANFGLIGILVAPFWVGFIIQAFHIGLLRLKKTPFNVALYGFSFTIIPIMTGFQGFYYPEGFIEYFIIVALIYASALIIKSIGSPQSISGVRNMRLSV